MPTLFPAEPLSVEALPIEGTERGAPSPHNIAREFVAWCCSFGKDFRNSPDASNFRYWLLKNKIDRSEVDETAVLFESRRLLLKRLEQSLSQ